MNKFPARCPATRCVQHPRLVGEDHPRAERRQIVLLLLQRTSQRRREEISAAFLYLEHPDVMDTVTENILLKGAFSMEMIIQETLRDLKLGEPQRFKNLEVFPLFLARNGGPDYL